MALIPADVATRLREVIVALDRRARRDAGPAEDAIRHDAAVIRERAVNRLAEIGQRTPSVPE